MEAVGILGGDRSGEVKQVIALRNLAGPDLFLADPYEQYRAEGALREAGLEVLGVYHSHPGGGIVPSALDLEFAAELDLVHVVVAVGAGRPAGDDLAAYRVDGGEAVEVAVVVTE